jgi:hypothetical protein
MPASSLRRVVQIASYTMRRGVSGARMRRRPREAAFVRNCGGACGAAVDPVQRWRALKRGFDLQITKTLPRRRTTLQSR